jgi:RHS repeat-associated protein
VHGSNAAADDPLLWFAGANVTSGRHYLHADHLGSVVAIADGNGASPTINSYDEYGIPGASNSLSERFGYTGQAFLSELGLDYYKARMYSPSLGRFLQTDAIGYAGGMNIYEYAMDDPVDNEDPTGNDCGSNIGSYASTSCFSVVQMDVHRSESQQQQKPADNKAENLEPKRGDTPVKLDPLGPDQQAQWNGISHTPSVVQAGRAAFVQSMKDGLERGFFIYSNQRGGYYPGRTVTGLPDKLPGLARSFVPVNPRVGNFDLARAYLHIHPGNFSGVGRADVSDQNFGRYYGIFTIILSREGVTVGY